MLIGDEYVQMVIDNITTLSDAFGLEPMEIQKSIHYAKLVGYQNARPSVIAIISILHVKPSCLTTRARKVCRINLQTVRKWKRICENSINNNNNNL